MSRAHYLIGLTALAYSVISFAEDTSATPTKPIEIKDIAKFSDSVTDQLNELIRNPELMNAAKETTVVNTKAYKEVVDKTIYKTTDAKVNQTLTLEEIVELKNIINKKSDSLILLKNNGFKLEEAFGDGVINKDSFSGKIMIKDMN